MAILFIVVGIVFRAGARPSRPTAQTKVVDIHLINGTNPRASEEALAALASLEVAMDARLMLKPPAMTGWLEDSPCDFQPIVRLVVASAADVRVATDLAFRRHPDLPVSYVTSGYGTASMPPETVCAGEVPVPVDVGRWDTSSQRPVFPVVLADAASSSSDDRRADRSAAGSGD